jgi:hypothetical protein
MCAAFRGRQDLAEVATVSARDRWLRRGLAGAWLAVFVMGGFAVASTWDRLLQELVRAPLPERSPREARSVAASGGEHAVAEARRLLDASRPGEALTALRGVRPEEPVYPFSLQLRDEASRALERGRADSR